MLQRFFHIFFPERCRGCRTPGSALCARCINRIPFADVLPRGTYAVFDYSNALVRATVRDLKYHRRSESARRLAVAALPHISEYLGNTLQGIGTESLILVPIPEHVRKETTRGFNQSTLLATWWKQGLPRSMVTSVLKKVLFTLPQAKLNRHARLKNVAHTMECTEALTSLNTYIVIDDVTTTGATFDEARRALRTAGATKIICIALSHGYIPK